MVTAITAIAVTVAIIRISPTSVLLSQGQRITHRLVADLRLAQSQALAAGKNHYLLFTSNGLKFTSYAIYRVETGGDVLAEPARTIPDSVALTSPLARAEFTPGGDALAAYTYTLTEPGQTWTISVTLATGAVTLQGR